MKISKGKVIFIKHDMTINDDMLSNEIKVAMLTMVRGRTNINAS